MRYQNHFCSYQIIVTQDFSLKIVLYPKKYAVLYVYGVFQILLKLILFKFVHLSESELRSDETVCYHTEWHKFIFQHIIFKIKIFILIFY